MRGCLQVGVMIFVLLASQNVSAQTGEGAARVSFDASLARYSGENGFDGTAYAVDGGYRRMVTDKIVFGGGFGVRKNLVRVV